MLGLNLRAENMFSRPGRFFWRVIKDFRQNQGILLSGAVAYYMLLSIVPLLALLLVGLSQIYPTDALLETLNHELQLVIPAGGSALTDHFADFLQHKQLVGWVGIGVLVFFSTMAFTVLENAMSVIFHHRVAIKRRHFLVSAVIPFLFIVLIGAGLLLITFISGALQSLDETSVTLFGIEWNVQGGGRQSSILSRSRRTGPPADCAVPRYASGANRLVACIDRWFCRGRAVGVHPPSAGVVFQFAFIGKCRLRLVCNGSNCAAEL